MFSNLLVQFWIDESGSVLAAEYLLLGSIVAMGSAAGLASVRDSMNDECREWGNSVHETRQQYTQPGMKSGSGSTTGAATSNSAGNSLAQGQPAMTLAVPTQYGQPVQFTQPGPLATACP